MNCIMMNGKSLISSSSCKQMKDPRADFSDSANFLNTELRQIQSAV